MLRPTVDDTLLQHAEIASKRSLCVRQNGAAIIDSSNRLVATGYNGPAAGFDHGEMSCRQWCPHASLSGPSANYDDCVSLHAEANALAHANRNETIGGTIGITRPPCLACAKLIAAAGIARAVYPGDPARIYDDSQLVLEFLEMCGVEVTQR